MTNFERIRNILTELLNTEITEQIVEDLYNKSLFSSCSNCEYYYKGINQEKECIDKENSLLKCNKGTAIYIQKNIGNIVEQLKDKKEDGKEVEKVLNNIFDFNCYYCGYNKTTNLCNSSPCSEGHIKWLNQEVKSEELEGVKWQSE